jgi:hypothetical protein
MESSNENKIRCKNCKCWRTPEDFIGKKGQEVKRCLKCREKDSKQKQKPEVREIRNKRQNEKQYYKIHREKKREENEEAYLKQNAEMAKIWRSKNKEHLAALQTKNLRARLAAIKQQANIKKIKWCDTMTNEVCKNLMESPCYYCNFKTEETLNGIDRIDSSSYYTINNCVSCCKKCNFMKTSLDINTFINRCRHISKFHNDNGLLNNSIWKYTKNVTYNSYKHRADKKKLDFSLTKDEFFNITKMNCYYCGIENKYDHKNGIDRKDNNIGYTLSNCVSSCGECNCMKKYLTDIEFIEQCKKISNYKNDFENISNIPECLSVICKRI